jgi:hypothetical protein
MTFKNNSSNICQNVWLLSSAQHFVLLVIGRTFSEVSIAESNLEISIMQPCRYGFQYVYCFKRLYTKINDQYFNSKPSNAKKSS